MADPPLVRSLARANDLPALRALAEAAGMPERVIERHLAHPRYQPSYTLLAERGGALLGYCLLRHERRRLGAARLEAGMIEELYAAPGRAQNAVCEALLAEAMLALAAAALPLALLHGPVEHYGPYGFAPYCYRASLRLPSASGHAAVPAGRARPVEAGDLADVAALYQASYQPLALAEERTPTDWRWWFAGAPDTLLLLDGRGLTAGYALLAAPDAHTLRINEAAAADGPAAAALLALLAARAAAEGAALELALAPAHPLARAALHAGASLQLAAAPSSGATALAGVVDLPGLLTLLTPELERRLAASPYAGWSGALQLDLPDERAALLIAAGRIAVADGPRPYQLRVRELSLAGAAQLLLGYRSATELHAASALRIDESDRALLDALFPLTWPYREFAGGVPPQPPLFE